MQRPTTKLRQLLAEKDFLYWPSLYYPLGGRVAEQIGIESAYVGGYVTGGSLAVSEPLLTMDEQVRVAGSVARAGSIPIVADAGAGFGEPLHCMRTVREFIAARVAGIHIEDQLDPKRAHYHKYVAHAVPAEEFIDKLRFACRQRDESDQDFVILARTDTCRCRSITTSRGSRTFGANATVTRHSRAPFPTSRNANSLAMRAALRSMCA